MIAKARFSVTKKEMTQILNNYNNGSRFSNFLIQSHSVYSEHCEVVGKSQEIMFLIGHIAGMGEDTLMSFGAV
jgi:aspartate 1-decarboxylase